MENKTFITTVIGAAFVLTQLSTTLYLPAMPVLVHAFNTPTNKVMLTLSIFFLGYGIGQLLWGFLSDSTGRKPVLTIALISYAAVAFIIPLVPTISLFISIYALLGFIAAAYTSVGMAMLKDLYGAKAARPIAFVGVAMATGPIIGPLLGGIILHWLHWQGIFVFMGIYALINLVLLRFYVPESHQGKLIMEHQSKLKIIAELLGNHRYLAYILTLGLLFGCFYTYLDVVPFIFTDYLHLSTTTFSWLFALTSVSYLLGAISVSLLLKKYTPTQLVTFGTITVVCSTLLFLVCALLRSHNIVTITMIGLVMMAGFGIVVPATKGGAMTSITQHNGTGAAVMKFTQTIITFALISIAALLHKGQNLANISLLLLSAAILAAIIFLTMQCQTLTVYKKIQ